MAALAIVFVMTVAIPKNANQYNYTLNALICDNYESCVHEVGHKMDDDLGRVSHSEEFGNALRVMLVYSAKTDDWNEYSKTLLTYGGILQYNPIYSIVGVERFSSPQEELYADLYRLSGGNIDNIPTQLQKFYSTDQKYKDLIQCLSVRSICGLAFRMHVNR